jgi:glyoxylase-like metal-dependent hydrolase (beta-lactamase superfamily II)
MSNSEHQLLVEMITNGPFMENCFIAADSVTRRGIVIDPGDEEQRIVETARELDIEVTEIFATHGHIDHAGAVAPLKRLLGVPFAIHPDDREWLARMPHQAMMFGLPEREAPEIDRELAHGDVVKIGEIDARVLHTPGHSAGGVSLLVEAHRTVFVGDTLFAGSIGRTDLPGGSFDTLIEAIKEQLLSLDDDFTVHCGHGPSTEIGAERRANPFLQPGARLLF